MKLRFVDQNNCRFILPSIKNISLARVLDEALKTRVNNTTENMITRNQRR